MREIRLSGSEGGEPQANAASLPLSNPPSRLMTLNDFLQAILIAHHL